MTQLAIAGSPSSRMMNDKTEPAATTTKTCDMTLDLALGGFTRRREDIRKAAHEDDNPRSPRKINVYYILGRFLFNGHNMRFRVRLVMSRIVVTALDVGDVVFGRHGCF